MKANMFLRFATVGCAVGAFLTAAATHAAYTDDLDDLRAELASRSTLLSTSTDQTEIKQKKACDQSIVLIDKPATSLATDIKTAKKVATKMFKAFPNEFLLVNAAGVTFSNNMLTVLIDTYHTLSADIQADIVTLDGLIAGLPAGTDKLKAAAQFEIATNLLALAQNAPSFSLASALLGKSLKAALKGQQIAINAGGGGGGGSCGTITTSTVTMTVNSVAWSATLNPPSSFAGGEYLVSAGFFNVGGTAADGSAMGLSVDSGVTGPGTYPIATNSTYTIGSPPTQTFTVTSGTIKIVGLDVGTWTACGTATFSATDGVTPITVTDVEFAIKDLGHE
jgi:hypothetical protein